MEWKSASDHARLNTDLSPLLAPKTMVIAIDVGSTSARDGVRAGAMARRLAPASDGDGRRPLTTMP